MTLWAELLPYEVRIVCKHGNGGLEVACIARIFDNIYLHPANTFIEAH